MIRRGVLVSREQFDAAALVAFTQALDTRGYDSLWLPELFIWVRASPERRIRIAITRNDQASEGGRSVTGVRCD